MDGSSPDPASRPTPLAARAPWHARLDLRVESRAGRSVLAWARHEGPLRIQKGLHPEGPSRVDLLILHPPAGIAGGDRLAVDLAIGPDAQARVTTPGAAKWYRSAGRSASQSVRLRIDDRAVLEWLPQESIAFDGARVCTETEIDCTDLARGCGWDLWVLGRLASGETFARGELVARTVLRRGGRPIWCERTRLAADDSARTAWPAWNGKPVAGTFWALGLPSDDSLLDACRAVSEPGVDLGVTRFEHGLWLARALATSAERLRLAFNRLWSVLRPALCGSVAVPPRIWAT